MWDIWFIIHDSSVLYLQKETLSKEERRMHGTFNGMQVSLFFLAVISFLSHREAAGDAGLPKDSNTVVGRPQLGEQNRNFAFESGPAQPLFILFVLEKLIRVYSFLSN